MSIGSRIKTIRGDISQADFAKKFGKSRNTIMRYEADGNPPDSDFVCVLCETYEVEANWLLFGNGPMKLEPHQKETHLDMFQDVFLGDKEAANRRALKMDDSGVVLRQSRQEAEELASKMITTLGLDESKSEYLRQTLQTTICQRLLAERQRDQAWEKVTTTPAPISDDNLGFGECAELLNKIFSSGNQVLIRAIAANLNAFSEAIDNKTLALNTMKIMKEMEKRISALEKMAKDAEERVAQAPTKKTANG